MEVVHYIFRSFSMEEFGKAPIVRLLEIESKESAYRYRGPIKKQRRSQNNQLAAA